MPGEQSPEISQRAKQVRRPGEGERAKGEAPRELSGVLRPYSVVKERRWAGSEFLLSTIIIPKSPNLNVF